MGLVKSTWIETTFKRLESKLLSNVSVHELRVVNPSPLTYTRTHTSPPAHDPSQAIGLWGKYNGLESNLLFQSFQSISPDGMPSSPSHTHIYAHIHTTATSQHYSPAIRLRGKQNGLKSKLLSQAFQSMSQSGSPSTSPSTHTYTYMRAHTPYHHQPIKPTSSKTTG